MHLATGGTPWKIEWVCAACFPKSLLYLWPDQIFDTLFQACLIISYLVQTDFKARWRAFVDGLNDKDEKVAKKHLHNSRLECKNFTLFWKPYPVPFGATHTYTAHIKEYWEEKLNYS